MLHTVFSFLGTAFPGILLAGGVYLGYITLKKGVPAVWASVKSAWTKTDSAIKAIEARLASVESAVGLGHQAAPAQPAPQPTAAPAAEPVH